MDLKSIKELVGSQKKIFWKVMEKLIEKRNRAEREERNFSIEGRVESGQRYLDQKTKRRRSFGFFREGQKSPLLFLFSTNLLQSVF